MGFHAEEGVAACSGPGLSPVLSEQLPWPVLRMAPAPMTAAPVQSRADVQHTDHTELDAGLLFL